MLNAVKRHGLIMTAPMMNASVKILFYELFTQQTLDVVMNKWLNFMGHAQHDPYPIT